MQNSVGPSHADPEDDSSKQAMGLQSAERIRALSDGIFAFAMTVLVLDIRLPELGHAMSDAAFVSALIAQTPKALSFLLSFVVLAMYWIAHHNTFLLVTRSNRPLIVLNLAFLLCIVAVPFAASFLGQAGPIRAAIVAYASILIVTSLVLGLLVGYALGPSGLVKNSDALRELRRAALIRIGIPIGVYAASIALAFVSRAFSIAVYVALPLAYLIPSRVDHWVSNASVRGAFVAKDSRTL